VQKVQRFWEQCGSVVSVMDVKRHDAVLAATSHLPHILAFALVDMLGHKDKQSEIFKYAAGGFRDFTRIASSDPIMWRDICSANKNEIIPLIQQQGSNWIKYSACWKTTIASSFLQSLRMPTLHGNAFLISLKVICQNQSHFKCNRAVCYRAKRECRAINPCRIAPLCWFIGRWHYSR